MSGNLRNSKNPRIAIVGAGAIGMYYGGRLAQHGFDVHFLMRSDYAQVRENGILVESFAGNFRIPADAVNVYDDPLKMPPADLVIVTLKATSNHLLPELIPPLLHEQTAILTMQNGLGMEDDLAAMFGADHVLGAMAFICCNRENGAVKHLGEGFIRLGEFNQPASNRAREIAHLFNQSKVDCKLLDDLCKGRWEKLAWNIPFNGLGALLLATTDRLLADPESHARLVGLMREVIAIARASGVAVADDLVERHLRITLGLGPYKTSMQVDREAGRPMEIEPIIGRPLKTGLQLGVQLPLMQSVYDGLCAI